MQPKGVQQKIAEPVVYQMQDDVVETYVSQGNRSEATSISKFAPKEEVIRFTLEDYTEKESELTLAKPVNKHQEDIAEEFKFSVKAPAKVEIEEVESIAPLEEELDEVNPMEMSIEEFTLKSRAAERRKKMKDFNYKFNNTNNQLTELEREPAYKRSGVDLKETEDISGKSRVSLGVDSNNDAKLRSNNSFLHDNVD